MIQNGFGRNGRHCGTVADTDATNPSATPGHAVAPTAGVASNVRTAPQFAQNCEYEVLGRSKVPTDGELRISSLGERFANFSNCVPAGLDEMRIRASPQPTPTKRRSTCGEMPIEGALSKDGVVEERGSLIH